MIIGNAEDEIQLMHAPCSTQFKAYLGGFLMMTDISLNLNP